MITISTLSQIPIYEQIASGIKELILKGNLRPQEQLPSIRVMARDLKVGIITVKRSYEELEKSGYISNVQGKGCFVRELNLNEIKIRNIEIIKEQLIDLKTLADEKGIEKKDFLELLDEIYGGK